MDYQWCANCGFQKGIRNGTYETQKHGIKQQFRCVDCGHTWRDEVADSDRPTLSAIRLEMRATMLMAFALYAAELPLTNVEALVGVQSETIRKHLLQLHREGRLEAVYSLFPRRWHVTSSQWEHVQDALSENVVSFAQKLSLLEPILRREIAKQASKILGRKVTIDDKGNVSCAQESRISSNHPTACSL